MTLDTLTPVDVIRRPNPRNGQLEAQAAKSRDGIWAYERIETPGDPWTATHMPSGTEVPVLYGTLRDARTATANGTALRAVGQAGAQES